MNGLPAPPPAVQLGYWLAKIHSGYEFHESYALRKSQIPIE